jgi:hypothetical protein
MENIFIFIAIVVFVTRLMKKIKKATPGGRDESVNKPVENPKPHPYKDKLEEMIRKMEEAEKLKKEGAGEVFQSRNAEPVSEPAHWEEGTSFNEIYGREKETTEYYDDDAEAESEFYSEETEDLPEDRSIQPVRYSDEKLSKSSVIPSLKIAAKKRSVLASLSKYSELQRFVIYKEILDSPVSEKY